MKNEMKKESAEDQMRKERGKPPKAKDMQHTKTVTKFLAKKSQLKDARESLENQKRLFHL